MLPKDPATALAVAAENAEVTRKIDNALAAPVLANVSQFCAHASEETDIASMSALPERSAAFLVLLILVMATPLPDLVSIQPGPD
jgi:hypothetical protein